MYQLYLSISVIFNESEVSGNLRAEQEHYIENILYN